MITNGIYATPNGVVANKNRKTKFDIICEDITHYNNTKSSLFDQLREDLKQYYIDILGRNWYSYINIIDVKYDEQTVIITELTSDEYKTTHEIPKEWYINREEYLRNLKMRNKEENIKALKKNLEECKRTIANKQLEIEKVIKRLRDLETDDILNNVL